MGDLSKAVSSEKLHTPIEAHPPGFEILDGIAASLENIRIQPRPPVSPTSLLDLPFELRLRIYHYCIPRKRIVNATLHRGLCTQDESSLDSDEELGILDFFATARTLDLTEGRRFMDALGDGSSVNVNKNKNQNPLLLVSKRISEEVLDVLYGENLFKLYLHFSGEMCLGGNISERNRRRMRYLLLVARPIGFSYWKGETPDAELWSSTLPNLKWFRFVAEQPLPRYISDDSTIVAREIDRWIRWIRPFLRCFGQCLSSGTIVDVDDDGRKETSDVVEECLLNGYRKVQCHLVGDLIFQRGRFSIESRYWDYGDFDD